MSQQVALRIEDSRLIFSYGKMEIALYLHSFAHGSLDIHESRGFFHIKEKVALEHTLSLPDMKSFDGQEYPFPDGQGTVGIEQCSAYGFRLVIKAPQWQRIRIELSGSDDEAIYGCGTQLSHLNLKGKKLPTLTREPGIGRGVQPLTFFLNTFFGAGGEWHCTSAPSASYTSSRGFALCLENEELAYFDFTAAQKHRVEVFSDVLKVRFFFGEHPKEVLTHLTEYVGRYRPLPSWAHKGAIIGLQGGAEKVRTLQEKLEKHRANVCGYWLQDWVGGRRTSIGKQLWWNWELDHETYPSWELLRDELQGKDIALLGYINPFLVDTQEKKTVRRNLLDEAKERDFLIKNEQGDPYPIQNTSFFAYLVDLSNPEAYAWLKEVIKTELLGNGFYGWMADFAEALPFDAVLHEGKASFWHNRYPVQWAALNREAIEEAGKEDEVFFFHRAGFTRSPSVSSMFWMGDQLADWGREDGLHSAVIGLISSGFSGFALNHGDIGGYIATTPPRLPIPIGYRRTSELLMRWSECFSCTALFRTHEGNQPNRHIQIDHSEQNLQHFARCSRIFASLHQYRCTLFEEASTHGYPVVRAMGLCFPDDPRCLTMDTQFMLGDELLMVPVLSARKAQVEAYVPSDQWVHIWSAQSYKKGIHTISAPLGFPCIFVKEGSLAQSCIEVFLEHESFVWPAR